MDICIQDLGKANVNYLKKLQCVEADLEIAKRITMNDKIAVEYFLKDLSTPFLEYIGKNIIGAEGVYVHGVLRYSLSISGEYYEFMGAKFVNQQPTWHKISLYRGMNLHDGKEARLYTYADAIATRHFIALKKKEEKNKEKSLDEMLESDDVSILREYNGFDEIILEDEMDSGKSRELRLAWEKLPMRDRLILQYLVIDELESLDVFDEMIQYVKTSKETGLYSRKMKQDAMSLMKQRAIAHLRKLIVELRKKRI